MTDGWDDVLGNVTTVTMVTVCLRSWKQNEGDAVIDRYVML